VVDEGIAAEGAAGALVATQSVDFVVSDSKVRQSPTMARSGAVFDRSSSRPEI